MVHNVRMNPYFDISSKSQIIIIIIIIICTFERFTSKEKPKHFTQINTNAYVGQCKSIGK